MKRIVSVVLMLCLMVGCPCVVPIFSGCTPTSVDPEPEPEPEPIPISEGAYKRVVILGVDGAGAFFDGVTAPNCISIFYDGAQSSQVITSYPSISAQCWGSMLHGVLPQFHRLTNDITDIKRYDPESPYPSIFRIAREARPEAVLASYCNWSNINYGIIEDGIGVVKGNCGDDKGVTEMVLGFIGQYDPTILFVAWDSVDAAGHGSGYGSDGHKKALQDVDAMIGQIYEALKKRGLLEDTLLIVSADHGGTPQGSHGGDTPAERNVYLGVLGKTVEKGGVITGAEVQDIPAIAAYALGLDIPETWTGRVPSGVFRGVTAKARKEIEIPVSDIRKHKTMDTPDITRLKTLLKEHDVLAYLPFDGSISETYAGRETSLTGKNYFYDAYFSKGISLVDGYVTLKDVRFGLESFSIAFWIKADEVNGDPSIISNKDWAYGGNDGFVLSLRSGDIKFNAGSSQKGQRMDLTASLPIDYNMGWMHVILTVDRKNDKVCIYYDFKLDSDCAIPASLKDVSFDALSLNIGQDGTGRYDDKLPAQLDDMIITADVLSAEDIAAMKEYYK